MSDVETADDVNEDDPVILTASSVSPVRRDTSRKEAAVMRLNDRPANITPWMTDGGFTMVQNKTTSGRAIYRTR